MHKLTTLAMVSMLALGSSATFATDTITADNWLYERGAQTKDGFTHHNMFDSVNLTEQQRLQMRDLMRKSRHHQPHIDNVEKTAMYKLITADKFDEAAVHAQVEKMSQRQIYRKVEMVKVRNQMYNLLTTEQKTILNQRYQQQIDKMSSIPETQPTSAQKQNHSQ